MVTSSRKNAAYLVWLAWQIFQSSSDSECIIHLMARSMGRNIPDRMEEALRKVEGAFSVVAMTRTKLIGVRDPLGVRPLVLGKVGDGYALSSETCALDIIGAEFVREIEPGEMVVITPEGIHSHFPFRPAPSKFCIFEHVYFTRPDSILGGRSVYETREAIGRELAKESPVEADLVCPVPDSGTPAAIGYSLESGIPYAMGIIRNQYMGRTFIEPTEQIRNMGVRLKLNRFLRCRHAPARKAIGRDHVRRRNARSFGGGQPQVHLA